MEILPDLVTRSQQAVRLQLTIHPRPVSSYEVQSGWVVERTDSIFVWQQA